MAQEPPKARPPGPAEQDRRAAPRYPASFDLTVTLEGQRPRILRCGSISQTGLFIHSDGVPVVGTGAALQIDLPYGTVRLQATVRRVAVAELEGELSGFAVQVDAVVEGEQAWSGLVRQARLRAPK